MCTSNDIWFPQVRLAPAHDGNMGGGYLSNGLIGQIKNSQLIGLIPGIETAIRHQWQTLILNPFENKGHTKGGSFIAGILEQAELPAKTISLKNSEAGNITGAQSVPKHVVGFNSK